MGRLKVEGTARATFVDPSDLLISLSPVLGTYMAYALGCRPRGLQTHAPGIYLDPQYRGIVGSVPTEEVALRCHSFNEKLFF